MGGVSTDTAILATAGHPGHLSESESQYLQSFKDLVSKAGFTHDDDVTLLRFLRARRWDLQAALKQYTATQEWRKKHYVDKLFAEFPPEEFEEAKKFYPRWTGRRENMGLPVFVYQISCLQPLEKELNAVKPERRYQRIIALHEHMTKFITPLCSSLPHPVSPPPGADVSNPPPISSVMTIIDLAGIHLTAMWRLRNHLQEASKLATANYPETLHTIAIVNAPGFFGTIWGWIKNWFDEGTRNKIHVLGTPTSNLKDAPNQVKGDDHTTTTLLSLMPASSLPRLYGGDLDFQFFDDPVIDEDTQAVLGVANYADMEAGPKVWKLDEKKWVKPTST